jgi:hypothetical protein
MLLDDRPSAPRNAEPLHEYGGALPAGADVVIIEQERVVGFEVLDRIQDFDLSADSVAYVIPKVR